MILASGAGYIHKCFLNLSVHASVVNHEGKPSILRNGSKHSSHTGGQSNRSIVTRIIWLNRS